MRAKDNMRSAAEVLVDQLHIHGVRHVFCVPGESYLAVLDAFHDADLAVTVCRQEGGAGFVPADRHLDVAVMERVEHRQIALARDAEHVTDAVDDQLID